MKLLRNTLLILSSAAVCIIPVSCGKHEKLKENSDIEQELESKYGVEFDLIEQTTVGSNDSVIMTFRDGNGVEFSVKCSRVYNIAADSRVEYSDDYIDNYLEKYGSEYISEITVPGVNADIDENNSLSFYVDSYSGLDALLEQISSLEPKIDRGSYIGSVPAKYYRDDLFLGNSHSDEADIRQFYVDSVRHGKLNEELPEAVMREYPAYDMDIYVNGRPFEKNDGVNVVYLKDTGDVRMSFYMTADSSGVSSRFDEFLTALGCRNVKSSRTGFEWDGGSIKFSDSSFDFVSEDDEHSAPELANKLTLRLSADEIERIFGAKAEYDPVFTGKIDIIT